MAERKQYLDQAGLERLVQYIQDALNNKANVDDVAFKTDLDNFITSSELQNYVDDSALNSALADVVREDDLNSALDTLKTSIATVYHYRGNVDDLEELQAIENPAIGDVYNIADTGMNAGWTGDIWDYFGSVTDLTGYLTEDEVKAITIPTVDSILYGGKSAVINDIDSLKAMIANSEQEVVIIVNDNISSDEPITIAAGKKVVLNLEGNKLSMGPNKLNVQGELVIDGNGEIEASHWGIDSFGTGAKVILNSGKITAQEAPMTIRSGAKFEMNGGELEGLDNCSLMGQSTAGNGGTEMIINGGTLIAHITSAGYAACGIYMPNDGKLIMNGGTIISDGAGILMRAGEVELNGGTVTANGAAGVRGKVEDSNATVGSYAVIFDESAKYPGASIGQFKLTIGPNMILSGTDGDLEVLGTGNVIDNR